MKLSFKTISMLMAGAAFALTSCSSEEPISNGPDGIEGEGIGYMAFSISTDQTRADSEFAGDQDGNPDFSKKDNEWFSDGQPNEYAICPNAKANLAIFFSNGAIFGASYLTPFDDKDDTDHKGPHTDSPDDRIDYPEQFYTYVTRWNNTNDEKPNQVLVLLNVNPDILKAIENDAKSKSSSLNLEDVLKKTEATANYGIYKFNDTEYFSMSNSVYFDKDANKMTATAISEDKVCTTPEKALENKVTVYVERMLSKFELTFGGDKLTSTSKGGIKIDPTNAAKINYVANFAGTEDNLDYPAYTPVTWSIAIGNWGINAVERNNYYFKQLYNINFFGSNGTWNAPDFHRSYWALSESYSSDGISVDDNTNKFPTQYRPTDNEDGGNKSANSHFGITNPSSFATKTGQTDEGETKLTYYSFNHYTKRGAYKYAPERTFGADDNVFPGLNGYGPYRFASHYLVLAQLVLSEDAENKNGNPLDDATTWEGNYLSGVKDKWAAYNFYFGNVESYIRYAYHRMVSQFADGRAHTLTSGSYTETYQTKGDKAVLYKDEALTKPLAVKDAPDYFTTTSALEIHGDGKVMLALRDGQKLWYKKANGEAQELTAADITNIAFNLAESAKHFKKGKMYYAIPVQHLFGKTNGKTVEVKKDGEYQVGQFGTVRNHWYKLNVKTIGNVGTPIDDPDQPIIPDPEDIYNIALEIVVLPWHYINNGDVDL